MTNLERFDRLFAQCPLVAILRGIRPDECVAAGRVLIDAGIRLIEVPMNSPEPLNSVQQLVQRCGEEALIGAGTVLECEQVHALDQVGGAMVISPNCNREVISSSHIAGLVSLPGVATPSEAFAALDAGANALKLFPADTIGPGGLRAWRAVLPRDCRVLPVGGIDEGNMAEWIAAGAAGFGLGSALYRAGMDIGELGDRARALVAALGEAQSRRG